MPVAFSGLVIPFNNHHALVYGPDAEAFGLPLFGLPAYVRPAYWLWEDQNYLLVDETIDDIGQRFSDAAAYAWLEDRGDAFPRADVIGVLPSGERKSVFVKELDLAAVAAYHRGHRGRARRLRRRLQGRPTQPLAHRLRAHDGGVREARGRSTFSR